MEGLPESPVSVLLMSPVHERYLGPHSELAEAHSSAESSAVTQKCYLDTLNLSLELSSSLPKNYSLFQLPWEQ